MTSTNVTAGFIKARRYVELFRRYKARPLNFARQKAAFYESYWKFAAGRIGAQVENLGNGLLRVSRGARCTYARFHHVPVDSYFNKYLVDDKAFVSTLVRQLGFLSPRYVMYTLDDMQRAQAFLDRAQGPCVVKPVGESGGRGITTGITQRSRLIQASLAASASFSLPRLMLEEQHPGACYRLLYLDGRLLHAVKRGRPTVVGDGVSPIRELIRQENLLRQNEPVVRSICELTVDLELKYTLATQGRSLRSVPAAGERLAVKNVCNQNSRMDQSPASAQVHPEYHDFAAGLLEELGTHLIGIDVMSRDIALAPSKAAGAILEINIPPGLHYHEFLPGSGQLSDIGSTVLDYALGQRRPRYRSGLAA